VESKPEPSDPYAALVDAEAARDDFVRAIALPSFFLTSIGAAISAQVATTAIGVADAATWAPWALLGGLAVFTLVAGVQLARFRRLNGVWVGGLASRVVGGTATAASTWYVLSLGAAMWAAFERAWWLVAVCAVAGGVAYALAGRRWVRSYRTAPTDLARGESLGWLATAGVVVVAGLVLLVLVR
jgi:hypothetical protein